MVIITKEGPLAFKLANETLAKEQEENFKELCSKCTNMHTVNSACDDMVEEETNDI